MSRDYERPLNLSCTTCAKRNVPLVFRLQ